MFLHSYGTPYLRMTSVWSQFKPEQVVSTEDENEDSTEDENEDITGLNMKKIRQKEVVK